MKQFLLFLIVLSSFLACQKSKQTSYSQSSSSDSLKPELRVIDSIVTSSKPILKEGVVLEHSFPELDTLVTPPLRLSVFRIQGELFVVDSLTLQTKQLTFTKGKIDTFFLSPSRKYAACLKVIRTVDTPGEWEPGESPYVTDICAIVVVTLPSGTIIREIHPSDFDLQFTRWISNSRFHYTTSDGFAVSSFYVFDAIRDTLQLL